jgi:FtsP/CotA-like multicopper oxidase with cupredoxin domain
MLGTGAAALQQGFAIGRSFADAGIEETRLTAKPATVNLTGDGHPDTAVWSYDGTVPGPQIRIRQGDPVRIVVANKLGEDTTVHWHGIRLPNAMDGVPGLTQPPIRPCDSFVYEFTPPDAGTFWYHPHADSLEQLGRGLAGALVVEEREPIAVDRDLLCRARWTNPRRASLSGVLPKAGGSSGYRNDAKIGLSYGREPGVPNVRRER